MGIRSKHLQERGQEARVSILGGPEDSCWAMLGPRQKHGALGAVFGALGVRGGPQRDFESVSKLMCFITC